MSKETRDSDSSLPAALPDADTLIGRLLDREATDEDRLRFERLASGAGELWKTLALRQLDMGMLSDQVCAATQPAERVDALSAPPRRWQSVLALSGAAAALLLGIWSVVSPRAAPGPSVQPAANPPVQPAPIESLSPRDLLKRYLASDFVIGEADAVLMEQQDLGGGRHQVWFVRRIEETAIIDRPLDEVVGEHGEFRVDPAELRRD